MTSSRAKAASSELTGGSGFTYEDTVVAYYLGQLLRFERAYGQQGLVTSVAIQQKQKNPMDDLVVGFDDSGVTRTLGLQIKRSITISGAESNEEFRGIISAAVATQRSASFKKNIDKCGFIVEQVTPSTLRSLKRLIDWAQASPTSSEFESRFSNEGNAAKDERELRESLLPLLETSGPEDEVSFYRHFEATQMGGLDENGAWRAEVINRLQELIVSSNDGLDILLFDRLCRIAREGSGTATTWTRESLLPHLRNVVTLRVIPYIKSDLDVLSAYSSECLNDVGETIDDFHVERAELQLKLTQHLEKFKVVAIGGLPGCGKSAVLKRFAQAAAARGPILFFKNDRLTGNGWTAFAASLGLKRSLVQLLSEIGSVTKPVLFIDGVDRIRPDQRGLILDVIRAIQTNSNLSNWRVLVTSRDQGLEAFRTWFPSTFSASSGIGDVIVEAFSEEESEQLAQSKPNLRAVLFGNPAVRDIARRPFFASVLARSIPYGTEPQTEVDLISAWWTHAGHDAVSDAVPLRQRALIDIAENGVRDFGKRIPVRDLKESSITQIAALKNDQIIKEQRGGASLTFSHDIFFEWAFFRLLIDLGDEWLKALVAAGEAPLLGRVVGILAQESLVEEGRWTAGYLSLSGMSLRRQWQREWLTAPPFTPLFQQRQAEFSSLLQANDYALFEKILVWFQAQHTIPSPIVLGREQEPIGTFDRLTLADMLGWPSDFIAWGRFIDWVMSEAPQMPVRLIPKALELFSVWQNPWADIKNPRSHQILNLVDSWLRKLEAGTLQDSSTSGATTKIRRRDDSGIGTTLRNMLLRSARSYPEFAKELFNRTIADESLRKHSYSNLIAFAPFMSVIAPELLAELARAELQEELPEEKRLRELKRQEEYFKRRAELNAIPEEKRTQKHQAALYPSSFLRSEKYDLDDIGIDRHHNAYYPSSALQEPFKSLFENSPAVAISLVSDLANRATTGWRQVHAINKNQMGTPLAVTVQFPWGEQQFWGDWHVYNWGMGQLAPQPLECAFLSLNYWAFKQLENGQSASEVIEEIIKGSQCYAFLGIALRLALEKWEFSTVTLPIATCQRLWAHDIARYVQEPNKDIDIFGFGFLSSLEGEKAVAKEFLDSRKSRRREVRELAMFFALNHNHELSAQFELALANFPTDLPFELKESKLDAAFSSHLVTEATRWASLGNKKNYKQEPHDSGKVAITYESPHALTEAETRRLEESTASLLGFNIVGWATKSLTANKLAEQFTLKQVVAHAKGLGANAKFDETDTDMASAQSVIATVAVCEIRFSEPNDPDLAWAWEIMDKIARMKEKQDTYSGSKINWHPVGRLVLALHHDRKSASPRPDSISRLLTLSLHPIDSVSELAVHALFQDKDELVRWTAGRLMVNLCIVHSAKYKNGFFDQSANQKARKTSLKAALDAVAKEKYLPLPRLPDAWVEGTGRRHGQNVEGWRKPDIDFDAQTAAKLIPLMPLEDWMANDTCRPLLEPLIKSLVKWTVDVHLPPWRTQGHSDSGRSSMSEWNRSLAGVLARVAPLFSANTACDELITPLLQDDEKLFSILAHFTDMFVRRHVLDSPSVDASNLALLEMCAARVIGDNEFSPDNWQAGQVTSKNMQEIISTLLFVNVDKPVPGAARFANGNWTEIDIILPLVNDIVRKIGWAPFVMRNFLELCERAGQLYPIARFGKQANAALARINENEEGWTGTTLPARLANTIQRQADWNFPLRVEDAQELLIALDKLIDLGDRRSAALEQTEAFRGVQGVLNR